LYFKVFCDENNFYSLFLALKYYVSDC
jgi:hypothetical protein